MTMHVTASTVGSLWLVALGFLPSLVSTSQAEAQRLYWTAMELDEIHRVCLDGSHAHAVDMTGVSLPNAIAIDSAGGKMYWNGSGLFRANLGGSGVEVIADRYANRIAIDSVAGKIYWTHSGSLWRANLDGSNMEELVAGQAHAYGLALDVAGGKMYWTLGLQFGSVVGKIQRANLDGTSVETVYTTIPELAPKGIALNVPAGHMYWTLHRMNKGIWRANLDGSNAVQLIAPGFRRTLGFLAVDPVEGKIYFASCDVFDRQAVINKADLDGSNIVSIVDLLPGQFPSGIALDLNPCGGPDCNANGNPDQCDICFGTAQDCNGNDVPDECDMAGGASADCNANGVPDECDVEFGTSEDCDANVVPDECQDTSADCNNNGVWDPCDVAFRTSPDCDGNGHPDECDIAYGLSSDCTNDGIPDECEWDCNANGHADSCDILEGTSGDCNGNGIPDECIEFEDDCNGNLVPDGCDIGAGASGDCNINGIPDECLDIEMDCNGNLVPDACDLTDGTSVDCNLNDIPDECDFFDGFSVDQNGNGIPDECDQPVVVAWQIGDVGGDLYEIRDTDGDGIYGELVLRSFIPDGGVDVALEFYLLDWGPYLLNSYFVEVASRTFSNGIGVDLGLADVLPRGAVFIDQQHPDFVLPYLPLVLCDPFSCTGSIPTPHWDSVSSFEEFQVPDYGEPGYGGTMVVRIPRGAQGTYTIGFSGTYLNVFNPDGSYHGYLMPVGLGSAELTIIADCNSNDVLDEEDLANGTSEDCNRNDFLDECDIADDTSADCNANGRPDECDVAEGLSTDCQNNGLPDECESDLDADGVIDDCDGCPNDADKLEPGRCGCGHADTDDDGDGVPNCIDQCSGIDDAAFAPDCVGAIPTVTEWGMVMLALLLLTAAKVVFRSRRADGTLIEMRPGRAEHGSA